MKTVSAFEIYGEMLTYPEFSTALKIILAHLPKNAVNAVGGLAGHCQHSSAGRAEELPEYFCLKQTRGFPGSSEQSSDLVCNLTATERKKLP